MAPSTDRKTGTIVRIFPDKAYGFLHCAADARDYFFHKSSLAAGVEFGTLALQTIVSFTVGQNGKGQPQAEDVRLVGSPTAKR